jgi:hypothetical protein
MAGSSRHPWGCCPAGWAPALHPQPPRRLSFAGASEGSGATQQGPAIEFAMAGAPGVLCQAAEPDCTAPALRPGTLGCTSCCPTLLRGLLAGCSRPPPCRVVPRRASCHACSCKRCPCSRVSCKLTDSSGALPRVCCDPRCRVALSLPRCRVAPRRTTWHVFVGWRACSGHSQSLAQTQPMNFL